MGARKEARQLLATVECLLDKPPNEERANDRSTSGKDGYNLRLAVSDILSDKIGSNRLTRARFTLGKSASGGSKHTAKNCEFGLDLIHWFNPLKNVIGQLLRFTERA